MSSFQFYQQQQPLILASSSPRRSELLAAVGICFGIIPANIEELAVPGESPMEMVERLARDKAHHVAATNEKTWVLAADTIVWIDDIPLGKPASPAEAFSMISKLQGRSHQVWTGISLVRQDADFSVSQSFCTEVELCSMPPEMCRHYSESGEPLDKAGGYGIQGIGGQFIREIRGSFSNVMGLDMVGTIALLHQAGAISHPVNS